MPSILTTNDYSIFKFIDGNRPITDGRVAKITKSIQANGYILSPIAVNEDGEIIDGQGRYLALKGLKMPVDYFVIPGAGIKECIALNAYSSKWTLYDYICSYASIGNESYIMLKAIYDKYRHLELNSVIFAILGIDKQNNKLMLGEFSCTKEDVERAYILLDYCDGISEYISKIPGRHLYYYQGLIFLYGCDNVDTERMKTQICNYWSELPGAVNVFSALESMSRLYNMRLSVGNRINLCTEYEQYLCGKYAWYGKKWAGKNISKSLR